MNSNNDSRKLDWENLKQKDVEEIKVSLNNINDAFDTAIGMLEESNDELKRAAASKGSLSSAFNKSYDSLTNHDNPASNLETLPILIETLVSNINISRDEIVRISQKLFDIKQHITMLEQNGISTLKYMTQQRNIEEKLKILIRYREEQLDGLSSLRRLYKDNENR